MGVSRREFAYGWCLHKTVGVCAGAVEVVVASILLYQYVLPIIVLHHSHHANRLLGLSAFAGFIVMIIGWPLNGYLTRRSIRIQKGLSTARDKRMAVLSELLSSVNFVKFFAWEEKWIGRVMDARAYEMGWMVKGRSWCPSCVRF